LLVSCAWSLPILSITLDTPDAEVLAYWTSERMSSAILKKPKLVDDLKNASISTGPTGPEGMVEGYWPDHLKRGNSGNSSEEVLGPVVDPTKYPYTTVGRFFFTQAGTNYQATANAIEQNIILTSGDSIFDFGAFSANMLYVPSYPARTQSYVIRNAWVYTGWSQNKLAQYDYGLATTTTPSAFVPTGWAGLRWNLQLVSGIVWHQVGYITTATAMQETYGSIVLPQPIVVTGTVTTNGADPQSSLGNVWWYEVSPSFYANGVNALGSSNYPTYRWSPYFDTAFAELFTYVKTQQ
jgi:hypothetical protein